jgi:hypothetical protein
MSIYNKLDVIDEFEEKFGEREAVTRSCDLMVAYISEATTPLPQVAAQAFRVAMNYKNGAASRAELDAQKEMLVRALRGRWTRFDDPESCAFLAIHAIVAFYLDPSWGSGASEVISNFWDLAEKFDRDERRLLRLLQEYFP